MITRRDKLLKNPWEQRKYENHLRKINRAVPVIDNKPPVSRQHVAVKLKKRQIEMERIRQIENDNLILLRRINYVMNTNRVDNWNLPPQQTKYLNRVPLSSSSSRPSTTSTSHSSKSCPSTTNIDVNHNHLRKAKCLACSPHRQQTPHSPNDDSQRIPWEEPKMYSKIIGNGAARQRSQSLPVIKTGKETTTPTKLNLIQSPLKFDGATTKNINNTSKSNRSKSSPVRDNSRKLQKQISLHNVDNDNKQKLVISSGSLKLCVKFPSDSHILLKNGGKERTVFGSQYFPPFK